MKITAFNELPISNEVLRAIQDMGFEEATPIQAESIPYILEGRDILGQAQTGTGKTCAFGIPIIERVDIDDSQIQYLILAPTRELAIQIADEMHEVTKYKEGIRILSVYGGQPIERQILALKKRPQIIVGTPGRVMDHMRRKTIRLDALRGIILDEADEMLNMGFKEDIDTILADTPEKIHKVFFSATMPQGILELTEKYLHDPIHVRITPRQLTVSNIEQFYIEVRESNKLEVLCRLIEADQIKLALIFCNTKRKVDEVYEKLQTRGYSAEALHGDMKQMARTRVMNRFKSGEVELLVATDVAARGIDVDDIEIVINYDLPQDEEYYVHRIGRTGRAGKAGKAYTFVVGREIIELKNIQHYTKSNIVCAQPPTLMDVTESRVAAILDDAKTTLQSQELTTFLEYIEKFVEGLNVTSPENTYYTTADVAAALLRQTLGESFHQAREIEPVTPYLDMIARSRPQQARQGRSDLLRTALGNSDFRTDAGQRSRSADYRDSRPGDNKAADRRNRDDMRSDSQDFDSEAEADTGKRASRGSKKIEPGMTRLFINVGKDDKVQPRQIVEAICARSSLNRQQIGAIAIYGRYTFVDVPTEAANEVAGNLSYQKIGTRIARVEIGGMPSSGPKSDKAGKYDKTGKGERSDRTGKTDKPDKAGKFDHTDKAGKSDKDRTYKFEKSGHTGKHEYGGKHDHSGKHDPADFVDKSDKFVKSPKSAKPAKSGHADSLDRPGYKTKKKQ